MINLFLLFHELNLFEFLQLYYFTILFVMMWVVDIMKFWASQYVTLILILYQLLNIRFVINTISNGFSVLYFCISTTEEENVATEKIWWFSNIKESFLHAFNELFNLSYPHFGSSTHEIQQQFYYNFTVVTCGLF